MLGLFENLDHSDVTLIVIALIGLAGTLFVGILNYVSGHRGRNKMLANSDTGNEKPIGETVHDISVDVKALATETHTNSQTIEILAAQLHTNTKEMLMVSDKVEQHWEAVSPLIKRLGQKEGLSE